MQTPGPLAFEPHAGYGHDLGVDMRMPFGYITAPDFKPLFELDHFFDCPPETLAAYAKLMAAAPDMLKALVGLVDSFEKHRPKELWDAARTAISKATL